MVAILLGTGFEEMEALAPCDCLRRAGIDVRLVGITGRQVTGGHGITVAADRTLDEIDSSEIEMLVLPGGLGGVEAMLRSKKALALIQEVYQAGNYLAAICAAPTVLASLHLTDGRRATCYPGMESRMGSACMQKDQPVVQDGKIITSTAAGTAMPFACCLVEILKGEAAAAELRRSLVYSGQ